MADRQFHGEGYDKSPFSESENARHRHMYSVIDKEFREIGADKLKLLDDAAMVTGAAKLIANLPKTLAWLFVLIGGAVSVGVWLASKGLV